ncbi:MAG: glycoside hydrolase family 127 protein [Armatimonadetes bacterium]|nr:glycoside hydrolase family 127 protein [Armatimonadota bacterium]MDE2206596.1 glycoside hydrolase family 127 protein [Armatimonadota bacterium]
MRIRFLPHATLVTALLTTSITAVPLLAQQPRTANLTEIPLTSVTIGKGFWAPRQKAIRRVSLPHSLNMLKQAGNLTDFRLAAANIHSGYSGPVFMDSDVYKVIEAVSYSLATHPDPGMEAQVEAIVRLIAAAQRPDGYLDTWYEVNHPGVEYVNLRDNHEMYCAGHMFEAAVAWYQATRHRDLLNVATRLADHLSSIFGSGPGKRMGYPGHPEIELALMKLYRVTGRRRYFRLARFFIMNRGTKFFATEHHTALSQYDGTYWLDNQRIVDRRVLQGHAVRAGYLMAGATDVAAMTHDETLLTALRRIWDNTTEKRMYVTGGVGSTGSNEGFTTDYDLPNQSAYQETCASVAMILWAHRMNLLFGDGRYADEMERALYNGMLDGVSLDGHTFFYGNPLACPGGYARSGWFSCACCPPNAARTIAALGEYVAASGPGSIYLNLFVQGTVQTRVDGEPVTLAVKTVYPWSGLVEIRVQLKKPGRFALNLRAPGWCRGEKVRVNGSLMPPAVKRGYIAIDRVWRNGDSVRYYMPMPVRRIQANPLVKNDVGKVALARGPLIYCLEGVDQSAPVAALALPVQSALTCAYDAHLLNGVVTIAGTGETQGSRDWPGGLYETASSVKRVPIRAIPWYCWDNRTPDAMEIWIPEQPPAPIYGTLERSAQVSMSYVSGNCQPWGINNGRDPASSGQQPPALCHWWPHKGTAEWVQYTWKHPVTIDSSQVYWFDDTGRGECRLPASWRLMYRTASGWAPVSRSDQNAGWPIRDDGWCRVSFQPVVTTALRLELQLKPDWAAGIQQWRVSGPDTFRDTD